MGDISREALNVLTFVAAVCALLLLASILIGLLSTVIRVGVRGRVLVLPFKGAEAGQSQLTGLIVTTLMEMEEDWTRVAHRIRDLLESFEERTRARSDGDRAQAATPLTGGDPLDALLDGAATDGAPGMGMSPRSIGDEFLDDILMLEDHSLAGADLGEISVAGFSFSPHTLLAAFERLPGISARRLLTGAIINTGERPIVTAAYEQRSLRGRKRRVRCTLEVTGDGWLDATEQLTFELAKARIGLLRDDGSGRMAGRRKPLLASGSRAADRTLVEAESWRACKAFLAGYAAQIEHYLSGRGSDRERALAHYRAALEAQPGYTRAAYNRATLLYNRYLPEANDEAIDCFTVATASDDVHDRALALAGVAMASCQAVHRFGGDRRRFVPAAIEASEQAAEFAPRLEEARFARAWAHQLQEEWDSAVDAYERVVREASATPPGRRIASFCANNAGWIYLEHLSDRPRALELAEHLLWQAVLAYPNKIAYGNLAEVARRCHRYAEALDLFSAAIALDQDYVAGWNERACVEVEMAAIEARRGNTQAARRLEEQAQRHHARAMKLVKSDAYAKKLAAAFEARLSEAADARTVSAARP